MIKAIAIDLDDTLLDTSGLLAPRATQDAFVYLINNGLKLTLAECEAQRIELIKTISHRDAFEKLAYEYGDENTKKVVPETIRLFYEPLIPPHLPMLEGARVSQTKRRVLDAAEQAFRPVSANPHPVERGTPSLAALFRDGARIFQPGEN